MQELKNNIRIKPIGEYRLGDSETIIHEITEDEVSAFAKLTGDYNPLHLDPDFADRTAFKKPVVYGMLSASYISTMIGMKIPGPGALWTSQTLEFLHQVYVGDILTIQATVSQISAATKTLVLNISITNQNGEKIIEGKATAKILEIEEKKEDSKVEENKVALITGASHGIGAEVALKLSGLGFAVALNYNHSKAEAEELCNRITASGGKAFPYEANVADAVQVEKMVGSIEHDLGHITTIVHCAAPENEPKKFSDLAWSDIQKHIDIQVKGLYNCCKMTVDKMAENEIEGRVVAIGSIYADGTPPALQSDYVIAKTALSALIKTLAVEYGPKKIAFNLVSPAMTQTERILHVPDKAKMMAKMQAPARSLQTTEEVAEAVAFLALQKTCALTGETIRISGGATMI